MGGTLIIWKAPVVDDEEEAERLLADHHETGDVSAFEPSADVARFFDELLALYPPLEEPGALPATWAATPTRSDRIVSIDYGWSASDEFLDDIERLARKHRLLLYDPQGPTITRPDDPPDEPFVPDVREVARVALIGAGAIAAALLAWWASITIVSWLVIIVAGFLAIMAVGTLLHYAHERRRARQSAAAGL
jgi:hypothetical protein